MKKLLTTLIGSFTITAALPAFAGPDWQLIEKARERKQVRVMVQQGQGFSSAGMSGTVCPVAPLVLPVDHGPRAQTTPYENQLRKERHEAAQRACGGTAK